MPVNLSSRTTVITIGGVDFSPCFVSLALNDPAKDRGLLTTSGTLTLASTPGRPESLDNLENSRFRRGQTVIVEIAGGSGGLVRHPRGALRILSAVYNAPLLELEVGCLLAYRLADEATDPEELGLVLGQATSFGALIAQCLSLAGITSTSGSLAHDVTTAAPISPGASYLETAGDLAQSVGAYLWCTNQEVVRLENLDVQPASADFDWLVGYEVLDPERNRDPELPAEKAKGAGTTTIVVQAEDDWEGSTSTERAPANTVSPLGNSSLIVVGETTQGETLSYVGGVVRTSTIRERLARGLVFGGVPVTNGTSLLAGARVTTVVERYEPLSEGGKLLERETTIEGAGAFALADFAAATYADGDLGALVAATTAGGDDIDLLAPNSTLTSTGVDFDRKLEAFTYDSQDQLQERREKQWLTRSAILGQTGIDWAAYLDAGFSLPSGLELASETVEEYHPIRPGQWKRITKSRTAGGLTNPERFAEIEALGALVSAALAVGQFVVVPENSTSGQCQPPATERAPAQYASEDYQLSAEARLPQQGSTGDLRVRIFDCPYLASSVGVDRPNSVVLGGGAVRSATGQADCTVAQGQLQEFARLEAAVRWGRFTGSRLDFRLTDALLSGYRPLAVADVTYPDGAKRRFGLDAVTWVITPSECRQSADGLYWGLIDATTGALTPPYQEFRLLQGGYRYGGTLAARQYALQEAFALQGGYRYGGDLIQSYSTAWLLQGGYRYGGNLAALVSTAYALRSGYLYGGSLGPDVATVLRGGYEYGGRLVGATAGGDPIPDIPDLRWYLNADYEVYQSQGGSVAATGDPVGYAVTRGDSGLNAAQTTSGAKPTLSSLGGLPSLTFDGGDWFASGSNTDWNFLHNGTPWTIVVAFDPTAAIANNGAYYTFLDTTDGRSANRGLSIYYYNDVGYDRTLWVFMTVGTVGLWVTDLNITAGIPDASPHLLVVSYTGSTFTVRRDGTQIGTQGNQRSPDAGNTSYALSVGRNASTGDGGVVGEMPMMAIFDRALTTTEIGEIEGYWTTALGI